MKLGMRVGLVPGHIVLDGDPAPPTLKRGTASPIFGPHLLWPNGGMDQDATWYGDRPRPMPHCLDGDSAPAPLQKKGEGTGPQFSAHVCCGQTAGWIKMLLSAKVGFGQEHIVLHGDPAHPQGEQPPIFSRCLLWPNGRPSQVLLSTWNLFDCCTVTVYEKLHSDRLAVGVLIDRIEHKPMCGRLYPIRASLQTHDLFKS